MNFKFCTVKCFGTVKDALIGISFGHTCDRSDKYIKI